MRAAIFALLLIPAVAKAETIPARGQVDPHVRTVPYSPRDVFLITTRYGVSTHIRFGPGEFLNERDIAVGDRAAWSIDIGSSGADLFIKPIGRHADTNMTVITNKRSYQFALKVDPHPITDVHAWYGASLVYSLSFTYPEVPGGAISTIAAAVRAERAREFIDAKLKAIPQTHVNTDYWAAGSESIRPSTAWDDGRFIHLSFAPNRDMPAVYTVDEHGNEARVNTHIEGRELIVQRVVPLLRLRLAGATVCLLNRSFDLSAGERAQSGTVSPAVQREILGEDDGSQN